MLNAWLKCEKGIVVSARLSICFVDDDTMYKPYRFTPSSIMDVLGGMSKLFLEKLTSL